VDVAEDGGGDEEVVTILMSWGGGKVRFDEFGAFGFAYADVFLYAVVLGAGDLGALEG
jgi:hypothetical protein